MKARGERLPRIDPTGNSDTASESDDDEQDHTAGTLRNGGNGGRPAGQTPGRVDRNQESGEARRERICGEMWRQYIQHNQGSAD